MDVGDNLSDHLPIMMSLKVDCSDIGGKRHESTTSHPPSLKWDKCSPDMKLRYSERLSVELSESPSLLTNCHVTHCENNCKCSIQLEYDSLVNQLVSADKVLPRHKPGVQKSWWTEELTALKALCVDAYESGRCIVKPFAVLKGPQNSQVGITCMKV